MLDANPGQGCDWGSKGGFGYFSSGLSMIAPLVCAVAG
jgi:hypothetical protein